MVVKVETDQPEVYVEQWKAEASDDSVVIPDYHQTTVKTEPEPIRWVVYGNMITPKKEEYFTQQGNKLQNKECNQTVV